MGKFVLFVLFLSASLFAQTTKTYTVTNAAAFPSLTVAAGPAPMIFVSGSLVAPPAYVLTPTATAVSLRFAAGVLTNGDKIAIVTFPAPVVAPTPVQPRTCSFSFEDGLQLLTPGPNAYSFMGCPNNSGVPWTVTAIHCWSDNIGLSSTADVQNNAGVSFLLMPVLCSATQAGGGGAGVLANAPPNLPASSANTTLASGDAFNIKLVSDGITMDFRVTVDYQ
jgi:hypothetical protein